jgi:hypothetical protein
MGYNHVDAGKFLRENYFDGGEFVPIQQLGLTAGTTPVQSYHGGPAWFVGFPSGPGRVDIEEVVDQKGGSA